MKTRKLLFFAAAAVLFLSACGNKNNRYDATGVFEATEVIVSARSSGEIMVLDIEEGQMVDSLVPLGYIDTIQLYLKREQLLAGRKAAGSRRTDVNVQLSALRQQLETQLRERTRYENLLRSNAATQKQVDDINAQIEVLRKQIAAQSELLTNSNTVISDETAGIDIQIAQINDQIRNSIIKSPIRGTILSKYAQQGELAQQGKPLFKVADMNRMNLRVYITANQLTSMQMGQKVRVFADYGRSDRREYEGTVIWISDKAEFTPKTIQTRDERANLVYAVKVAVKNDGYIKKGMYGEIIL